MTFKRPLFTSSIRHDQTSKHLNKIGLCQVCGDKARIVNYGALSCSSCRTFFRRHGFHSENVPLCYSNVKCPITIQTRKFCTACRFAKCLAIGMSPDLIRKEDLYEKHRSTNKARHKLISKEIISLPQPCVLNLLSVDKSSLMPTNWKLLSNVIHAFDTYNSVLDTKKIINLISISSKNIQSNVENTLNMMNLIYTSLQSFVNCTADFRIMTTAEQCSLLQRNMQGIFAFYCIFIFRESGVFDNNNTATIVVSLYGYDNAQSTKRITVRLDHDLTLIKLMLITLMFSSNCFSIDEEHKMINDSLLYGTFRLFGSQNVYAEILWKYMIYRYGFFEAALRFDGLIKIALDALRLSSNIYNSNKIHQNFTDEIAEQCERELKLNGTENIPLWGKT